MDKRIEYAPNPYGLTTTAIFSVSLAPDEEAEWIWINTLDGKRYVSGYTIKKRVLCLNCNEYGEKCACIRNVCRKCGKPVGNITFTVCDDCW